MSQKAGIIKEIGEEQLLLPLLVNRALSANDRVKYLFTLLQGAVFHADNPAIPGSALTAEREASGVGDIIFDRVIPGSARIGPDLYQIPYAREVILGIRESLEDLVAPFKAADPAVATEFQERLTRLLPEPDIGDQEVVQGSWISAVTSGDRSRGDSLHILVMDLHRQIIALQVSLSTEEISGAKALLLTDWDRERVRAFMEGLNRTIPLKFGHPGLGTTAIRAGDMLLLQNDIGETDAHVVIFRISADKVTVIYSDIHLQRLLFFQHVLSGIGIRWGDIISREEKARPQSGVYHLITGYFEAKNAFDLDTGLTHCGSRLVFLIDWNRARKRLRSLVPNRDAKDLLQWAASEEIGHMGFLKLGGEKAVYKALEGISKVPIPYGEPLHQILGREKTIDFLKAVLRVTSAGLLQGNSFSLIQDEIKAELLKYFRSAHENLLEICEEHATLTVEVATVMEDILLADERGISRDKVLLQAGKAKQWETDADLLVTRIRDISRRVNEALIYSSLINTSDDVIDSLEDACFLATLASSGPDRRGIQKSLGELAGITVRACREYLRCIMIVRTYQRDPTPENIREFLIASDRIISLEREADRAYRRSVEIALKDCMKFQDHWIVIQMGGCLEKATNYLRKSVSILHDNILEGAL